MLNGFASSFTQRPAKSTDGPSEITPRGNGYGESFSQLASADGLDVFLNEGSYFSGMLTGYVPGTGALAAAQATFSDTSAFMMIKSAAAQAGAPVGVRLDTLKVIVSNVGAGITAARIVAFLDNSSRWGASPGGTSMAFAANSNIGSQQGSITQAQVGALAPGAATGSKRIVGQCMLKASAPVLGDEFVLRFSNAAQPSGSIAGTTAASIVRHMEPLIIAPGWVLILHAFFSGVTTGPQFEPSLTTIER
jgi:hypothetical protein